MLQISISGVPPWDGSYSFESAQAFTGHELHLIKQVAGVRLGEIGDALDAQDYDLVICLAVIALWRAGKATRDTARGLADVLLEAETGTIKMEEAADGPPAGAATPAANDDSSNSSSETSNTIGEDNQGTHPLATGLPG